MMGSSLEGITKISAGNVVAIGDLDDTVFKTATISDYKECPSLAPIVIGVLIYFVKTF
jgi:translation elongation factor EF-G